MTARRRLATRSAIEAPGRRREEGQILVLFTIAIVVIMLFASIVIDLGLLRNNRQILVNATDSAALAAGTLMPVDGCNNPQSAAAACSSVNGTAATPSTTLINSTMATVYPGITTANYVIQYRCLIGVDTSGNPYMSRDVPIVCNPRHSSGMLTPGTPGADHNPVAANFRGAGPTRYTDCYPNLGDRCNVVVISALTLTNYSFGRVVGVNQGSTGNVVSAACNGPCGQPPAAPVDLVILVDRTASMSSTQIANARAAAKAVLGVYDPTLQRVAIGFLGPSETTTTCSGTGGGPAVHANAIDTSTPQPPSLQSSQTATTVSAGATSVTIARPGGSNASTEVLIASITINNSIRDAGAGNVQINPPAGWNLVRATSNGAAVGVATYVKLGSATESNNYQFTFTNPIGGAPMTVRATAAVLRYANVDRSNAIDVSGGNTGVDNSGTINATVNAVNTTAAQDGLIAIIGMGNASGGSGGYFTGWTNGMNEEIDLRGTNAAGPSLGIADVADATPGNTGTTTATIDGGGSYVGQHVALRGDYSNAYGTAYPADLGKWISVGFTGTDTDAPTQAWNETYTVGGVPQNNTHIVSAINCFDNPGGTGTNLTTPVYMAGRYLQDYGRPNVKWGILLETDGEPSYSSTGDPGNYTCQSAVTNANTVKGFTNNIGQHIELFTVGFFDAGSDPDCPDSSGTYHSKNVTKALSDMATAPDLAPTPNGTTNGCVAAENTDQDHFFCQPKTSDLTTVFTTIATTFAGVRTHLVNVSQPPFVATVSPSNGPAGGGGGTITITGKYFTGATSVKFGGASVPFTVVSDTSITVTPKPSGPAGIRVDVIVTNDGGTSPINQPGDYYTFN